MVHAIHFTREAEDLSAMPSYSGLSEHSGIMTAHIVFMIIAWVFILPVGVVLSISGHRYTLAIRFLFLALNGLGLIFVILVNNKTTDLYKGNAHHTIGWIATGVVVVHALTDVFLRIMERSELHSTKASQSDRTPFRNSIERLRHSMYGRWYGITSQASMSTSTNIRDQEPHGNQRYFGGDYARSEWEPDDEGEDEYKSLVPGGQSLLENHFLPKGLRHPSSASGTLLRALKTLCKIIDWTILMVGYVTLVTGGVTYTGIFRGSHIYNGLAHFIKGGIFFWYGLLTLGRWLGCFSNVGWAWNVKPACSKTALVASIPSAEFVESFVIFLYGSTNMFLEHLAGWGKAWTASDLEHVSISVMFFGGGLCGMLIESKAIQDLLNTKLGRTTAHGDGSAAHSAELQKEPKMHSSTTNTMPAIVIFLVGIVMSSHHQKSAISTTIHKQWGMLLAGFSIMRIVTYIVMYISPATSIYPSRPPSELVASFCLISGGLVFMASTTDIVQAIEANGLMAMFVFTIAMGLTAFIMAWEIAVLSIKGWAERSKARRTLNVAGPEPG